MSTFIIIILIAIIALIIYRTVTKNDIQDVDSAKELLSSEAKETFDDLKGDTEDFVASVIEDTEELTKKVRAEAAELKVKVDKEMKEAKTKLAQAQKEQSKDSDK